MNYASLGKRQRLKHGILRKTHILDRTICVAITWLLCKLNLLLLRRAQTSVQTLKVMHFLSNSHVLSWTWCLFKEKKQEKWHRKKRSLRPWKTQAQVWKSNSNRVIWHQVSASLSTQQRARANFTTILLSLPSCLQKSTVTSPFFSLSHAYFHEAALKKMKSGTLSQKATWWTN